MRLGGISGILGVFSLGRTLRACEGVGGDCGVSHLLTALLSASKACIWASCTLSGVKPWIARVKLLVALTMWSAGVKLGVVR